MTSRLNLQLLESRMNQLVIDLHDAARLADETDRGISVALRSIAHELHDLVTGIRRLLVSNVDSTWGDST
jgi:hypothetical protein